MANMSYCRFENTLSDLRDCAEHWEDEDLSKSEQKARKQLLELCQDILDEYYEEVEENE